MKLLSVQDVLTIGAADGRALEPDPAGAGQLADAVRANELLERVDLLRFADDLEHHRVGPDVRDASLEHLGERHQLGPALRRRRDRDQRELALDRLARLQLADAQDVDELVHLLLDLRERLPVAVDAGRDRRHVVPLRRADRQAFDVVPAPGEQLANAYEGARLVLDQDRQRVDHADTTSVSSRSSYSTMSSAGAPAGIIGKQCSSASTRASTTAVRPHASASTSAS